MKKKLIGSWKAAGGADQWKFSSDGTFSRINQQESRRYEYKGVYSINNGMLSLKQQTRSGSVTTEGQPWSTLSTVYYGIKFSIDEGGKFRDGGPYITLDYKNWGNGLDYYPI